MIRRTLSKLAAGLFVAALLSCGSSRSLKYASPHAASGSTGRSESKAKASVPAGLDFAAADRKLTYSASVKVRVRQQPDSAYAQLLRHVQRHGGYLLSRYDEHVEVRVPAGAFTAVLDGLPRLGKVEHQTIRAQDVTDEYTDNTIRLDNVQKARQRYLDLLARTTNVTELLAVEKELQRLNTEHDQLQGRLNQLDKNISYAAIDVELLPRVRPGPVGYVFVGLYKAVSWLFVRG